MCKPTTVRKSPAKEKIDTGSLHMSGRMSFSRAKAFTFVILAFAISFFIIFSERMGRWTKKYTSTVDFSKARNQNMTGRVALITGANTGMGYQVALELARMGADVIMAGRSVERGEAVISQMKEQLNATMSDGVPPSITFLRLDLASFASVEKFVKNFLALRKPLHVLLLNAGVVMSAGPDVIGQEFQLRFNTTEDGFEYHIGVNHLAHAYLTKLLGPKLKQSIPSRLISVSSAAERAAYESGFVFEQWVPVARKMPQDYEAGKAFGQSKLANLMFVKELAEQWNGTGVTAYALHPGVIRNDLSRYINPVLNKQTQRKSILDRIIGKFFDFLEYSGFISLQEGSLTQLHLATTVAQQLTNGAFYHPIGEVVTPSHPQATNTTLQNLLWQETEKAIQLRHMYKYFIPRS